MRLKDLVKLYPELTHEERLFFIQNIRKTRALAQIIPEKKTKVKEKKAKLIKDKDKTKLVMPKLTKEGMNKLKELGLI